MEMTPGEVLDHILLPLRSSVRLLLNVMLIKTGSRVVMGGNVCQYL